jgi:hypothetical protein
MKVSHLILGLALAVAGRSQAQVSVQVSLDQEQFLQGESLPAAVRIVNRSGRTLHLGAEPDWLTFGVESREGFIVVKNGEVPVLGEFDLETSQVATKYVDLSPYFVLPKQGRYTVVATVHLKGWDERVSSQPKQFDIIDGARLWSKDFGVPGTGSTNGPPEVRRFTLEQANYLQSQLRLYLRLTDTSESRVFKVVPIGPMVSFGQPEAEMDNSNNLHVLYQYGARSFNYSVFDTDGNTVLRQTYDYYTSRPKLKVDKEGKILVFGGARRLTSDDLPKTSEIEPLRAVDGSVKAQ